MIMNVSIFAAMVLFASGADDSKEAHRAGETVKVPVRRMESFHGTKAGDEIEVHGIKLCWCPPGKFQMGSPLTETNRHADEEQVEVTLSRGYWMGKFEVTQRQWKQVMGTSTGEAGRELNAGVGENLPIYWVSFEDAANFVGG